jgi:hypothetical protein
LVEGLKLTVAVPSFSDLMKNILFISSSSQPSSAVSGLVSTRFLLSVAFISFRLVTWRNPTKNWIRITEWMSLEPFFTSTRPKYSRFNAMLPYFPIVFLHVSILQIFEFIRLLSNEWFHPSKRHTCAEVYSLASYENPSLLLGTTTNVGYIECTCFDF